MGETGVTFLAVTLSAATGCINLFIDGVKDFDYRDVIRDTIQTITPARSPCAFNQALATRKDMKGPWRCWPRRRNAFEKSM